MTDCLFECLKEAHLDRYYPNFIQRGLHNCESLVTLSMPDYPRYGVVSMEDRLHLFKLIQIIKSIQGEGVICQHNKQSNVIKSLGTKTTNGTSAIQGYRPKEVLVKQMPPGKNGLLSSDSISTAPFQQQKKEQHINKVSRPPGKPLFREKPLFQWNQPTKKSPEVIFRKGSDSPIFKCRKTLRFTDSECESSDDEGEGSGVPKAGSQPAVSATQEKVPNMFGPQNPISQVNSTASAPRAFFINAQQPSSTANKDTGFTTSVANNGHTSPLKQAPIILSKEPSVPHAYFPQEDSSKELKPVYVEKIHHSGGYDYGVPTTPSGKTKANGQLDVGKIQVCIRKRPLTASELKRKEMDIVKAQQANCLIVNEPKLAVDLTPFVQQHIFHFDQVFDDTSTNEDVYRTAVKPLVKCIFNRGTATCFAFGQTGAGKTYTLLGSKSIPGMYRLAGHDIFDVIKHQKAQNTGSRKLSLWISYFEIYCGQLFDLLNKRKKLHVRENGKQKVCIGGLAETQVQDVRSLVEVIQYGNTARSTGSTGINPHSSRSHAVLQMELRDYKDSRVGRLSFIDLAGSERASDVTEFDRQTRIEGAEINQSLLALKECIRSIDQDNKHTPYRQSKLTHILRESFVGNSQTVMIANVAPSQSCCENTLNTLRYADRVKELKKDGKPGVHVTPKVNKSSQLASNRTPKRTPPSLFHPSKIPFSSTPKVEINNPNTGGDLNEFLENADESPIRGHQIQRIKLQKKRRSHGYNTDHASSEGSYGDQPKSSDMNNNSYKNEKLNRNRSDEVNHERCQNSGQNLQKSGITGEKVGKCDTHSTRCNSSVIVKETLSDTDISRYSILGNLQREGKQLQRRSNSQGSVCFSEQDAVGKKFTSEGSNNSADSSLSTKSDNELAEGHLAIINHLDRVLSKAKSVVKRMSPKTSGFNVVQNPGEQTSASSQEESQGSKKDGKHPTVIKRTLFKDSCSDVDYSSGRLSQDSTKYHSDNVCSRESSQERDGSMGSRLNSRDIVFPRSRESSCDRSDPQDFTKNVLLLTSNEKSTKDNSHESERYYSSGSDSTKFKHGNRPSVFEHKPPATTSKLEDMREPLQEHKWVTTSLRAEGKHLYYQHSIEPKALFINEEAISPGNSSNVSGVRNLDTETDDNIQCSKDKFMLHNDLVIDVLAQDTKFVCAEDNCVTQTGTEMPFSARSGHVMQRTEPEMSLSARDRHVTQRTEPEMPLSARDRHVTQRTEPEMPLSARDNHVMQRTEPEIPLGAMDNHVKQRTEPAMPLHAMDNHAMQRTEHEMPLSARDNHVTQRTEPAMPPSAWDNHVTQRTEHAVPLSALDNRVTQRTESAMPLSMRNSHVTQRKESAMPLSTRDSHVTQRTELAMPLSTRDSHVTQRTELTMPLSGRDNHVTQMPHHARNSPFTQITEPAIHVDEREPTLYRKYMKEDIAKSYPTEKQISDEDIPLAGGNTDAVGHQSRQSRGIQCSSDTVMSGNTKQQGEETFKRTLSDAASARKVLNSYLMEDVGTQSSSKYSEQCNENKYKTSTAGSYDGQEMKMCTVTENNHEEVKDSGEDSHSIEKRSWASILSQSNESHSLQSSQDSGISTYTQLTSVPKMTAMQPDDKSTSHLLVHADSAFTVISSASQNKSQSHSADSTGSCSSCNMTRPKNTSGEAMFMPIEPCSVTSVEKTKIAMPIVVTKTVLSNGPHDVKAFVMAESGHKGFEEHAEHALKSGETSSKSNSNQLDGRVTLDNINHRWINKESQRDQYRTGCEQVIQVDQTHKTCTNQNPGHATVVHTSAQGQTAPSQNAYCETAQSRSNYNISSHNQVAQDSVNKHITSVEEQGITSQHPEKHCSGSVSELHNPANMRQGDHTVGVYSQNIPRQNVSGVGPYSNAKHQKPWNEEYHKRGISDTRSSCLQHPELEGHHEEKSSCEEVHTRRPSEVEHAMPKSQSPDNSNHSESADASIMRTQNELIGEHEEQLSNIIALCKQEMRLLIDVKNGTSDFDEYLSLVKKIQNIKARSVNGLLSKIEQYSHLMTKYSV